MGEIIVVDNLFGFITSDGCQVVSNDRTIMICLSKRNTFIHGQSESETFLSSYFIRESGNSWVNTSNGGTEYMSIRDFLSAIRQSSDFSKAYTELKTELNKEDYEK